MALRVTSVLMEMARHALASYGDDLLPRALLSTALYNRGVVLGKLGHDDEALPLYGEVIAQPVDDPAPIIEAQIAKALVNKANILRRRGDDNMAFDLYCRAVECSTNAGADMFLFEEPVANAVAALAQVASIDEHRAEAMYVRVIASGDLRAMAPTQPGSDSRGRRGLSACHGQWPCASGRESNP